GKSTASSVSIGGGGGGGGVGVAARDAQVYVKADGEIAGGDGGAGGSGALGGFAGDGGVGLLGKNLEVITSGTISGGISGDNSATRANAILFTGGANRLELHAGSTITGVVDATADSNDTFALGGDTD